MDLTKKQKENGERERERGRQVVVKGGEAGASCKLWGRRAMGENLFLMIYSFIQTTNKVDRPPNNVVVQRKKSREYLTVSFTFRNYWVLLI